ncbi:MAG: hypothetical protein ACI9Y8_001056 [Candidatus Omnitrophota bacterium]
MRELKRMQSTNLDCGPLNQKRKFFRSSEGKIILIGISLIGLYGLAIIGGLIVSPEQTIIKNNYFLVRLFIGTAAGVLLGYAAGFGQVFVILANMFINTIVLFIVYPLLILVFQGFVNTPFLEVAR